ncbi:MAG TPA: 7-cyano-7-deazaguanine synthase QueC [Acidobacteriota bacterium]|nr:7-cyano-7-deazaguanine synthase QueC [Acidobacteriota bacterium]
MASAGLVLFSGGIDSTTTLAIALREIKTIYALTFDYGQRHLVEIEKAKRVINQFQIKEHFFFKIDLRQIGGSALTSGLEVPKERSKADTIPITYVPGRNLIFLSIAAAFGETRGAFDLFYGANVLDYSGYPDCRPEFIEALEQTLNRGTKAGVEGQQFRIHAPLLKLTKAQIIQKGIALGVDYSDTHSCYDPDKTGKPCGQCDSCIIRAKGFEEAGIPDPIF